MSRTKKITSLTPEQIAMFPEFVERWTKIGLCTDPADRPAAEAAIREMYRIAGLTDPQRIVWCGSPFSQALTRAIVFNQPQELAGVGANVRDSVRRSVWASVLDSVWDSVKDSVWDSVGANVMDSVLDSVRDSVRDSVENSVWAGVGDSVRDSVWDSVYGQHDASWLGFYDYFHDACGLGDKTEKLSGLWSLAKSAGWALPHANICWVTERHTILKLDNRGRLHSLDGPACAYPDGWAIHAVHGVRVPADIIEQRSSITVDRIKAASNAEVRRVMIELFGEDRWIVESGMRPVAHDEVFGTLYVQPQDAGAPIAKLHVTDRSPQPDGTFRRYWLDINPSHYDGDAGRIPQAASASTWRTSEGGKELLFQDWREYQPAIET